MGVAVAGTAVLVDGIGMVAVVVGGAEVGVACTGSGVGVTCRGAARRVQAVAARTIPSAISKSHSLSSLIAKPPFGVAGTLSKAAPLPRNGIVPSFLQPILWVVQEQALRH